jgi:hypothetical protein
MPSRLGSNGGLVAKVGVEVGKNKRIPFWKI